MKDKLSILKELQIEIKYGIILTDLLMTLYVLWLIVTNKSTWLAGAVLGFTPYGAYLLLRANKLYDLCICHKLMIIHIMCVYTCCIYQAEWSFGEILPIIRWLMLLTGVAIFLLTIIKKCYGCKNITE